MPRRKSTRKAGTRRKTQKGRGVLDVLKKAHSIIRDNKLISRGLSLTPFSGAAAVADMLGYGRKKKGTTRVRRRTTTSRRKHSNPVKMHGRIMSPSGATLARRAGGQMGRGIFGDIGNGIGSIAHGFFG